MRDAQRPTELQVMTTTCAPDSRTSASSTLGRDRRTDRQVHAELERRLEAHLLIARRIRTAR